jgi:hypothetical protein
VTVKDTAKRSYRHARYDLRPASSQFSGYSRSNQGARCAQQDPSCASAHMVWSHWSSTFTDHPSRRLLVTLLTNHSGASVPPWLCGTR